MSLNDTRAWRILNLPLLLNLALLCHANPKQESVSSPLPDDIDLRTCGKGPCATERADLILPSMALGADQLSHRLPAFTRQPSTRMHLVRRLVCLHPPSPSANFLHPASLSLSPFSTLPTSIRRTMASSSDKNSSPNILKWASKDGEFKRQVSSFRDAIQKGGEFPPEKGRYHL